MLVFVTRYSILGGLDRSEVENTYYRLARDTRAKMVPTEKNRQPDSEACLAAIRTALEQNAPTDAQIHSANITLSGPQARYVMFKIADFIQSKTKELQTTVYTNVEHIYPQNPKDEEWGGEKGQEALDKLAWHIGNLTVLSKRLNSKAANAEYGTIKREIFSKSSVKMTNQVAEDYSDWNEENILKRAEHLTNYAKQIWKFDNTSMV